jgi:hypothetical protein
MRAVLLSVRDAILMTAVIGVVYVALAMLVRW